jgi:hypothetical protein
MVLVGKSTSKSKIGASPPRSRIICTVSLLGIPLVVLGGLISHITKVPS